MKLAISHFVVITIGYCQMQLSPKMLGFQLQFDFDWLLYQLYYIYKVMRVRHINVLDLFIK